MQEQLVHLKTGDADSVLPHFSEKFPEYIAHQRKELATLLQPEGSKYARYTLAAASRAFLDIVGARPLLDCRPKDLQEFARVLARVPANHAKLQRFARLTLREAADANDGLDKPYRTLGAETIRRQYVGPIKYGFEWMCGDERAFSPLASRGCEHRKAHSQAGIATQSPLHRRWPCAPWHGSAPGRTRGGSPMAQG